MKEKLLHHEDGRRTFCLIFEDGEEIIDSLIKFSIKHQLGSSYLSGSGGLAIVTLGYDDPGRNVHNDNKVRETVQVLSLDGFITIDSGTPHIDARAVIGKADGTALGGKLLAASASPRCEIIVSETPRYMRRHEDPHTKRAAIPV